MSKGYWIPHLDVPDMGPFQAYRTTADAWHRTNGSELLARGGRREVLDGKARARNVLRAFDSYALALSAYASPQYTRAHALREGKAECDFIIVEGYDGPQPPPVGTPPPPARLKGYWIAQIDVSDPAGYEPYTVANQTAFGMFGARYLVRAGQFTVVEGSARTRHVVVEFPSFEAALTCYRSPAYQAAKALCAGKAAFDLVAVEGYDGKG
jgi:uncharacterized protein (DUF1330 family)